MDLFLNFVKSMIKSIHIFDVSVKLKNVKLVLLFFIATLFMLLSYVCKFIKEFH